VSCFENVRETALEQFFCLGLAVQKVAVLQSVIDSPAD
jgi:hypothetical protein